MIKMENKIKRINNYLIYSKIILPILMEFMSFFLKKYGSKKNCYLQKIIFESNIEKYFIIYKFKI